jgi:uncharacterized repeat protein (TIGR04076 family)
MDDTVRDMLKEGMAISDEDMAKLNPDLLKALAQGQLQRYQIIAEVTHSKYCGSGIKVGDKIVMEPYVINQGVTTCPLCIGALAAVYSAQRVIADRILAGREPNVALFNVVECPDLGIEHGGLGKVRLKVYAQEKAP